MANTMIIMCTYVYVYVYMYVCARVCVFNGQIQVPTSRAVELAERLLQFNEVQLAGLGARDSLRMEAALCLYGQELTEIITPIEAGLSWCIS